MAWWRKEKEGPSREQELMRKVALLESELALALQQIIDYGITAEFTINAVGISRFTITYPHDATTSPAFSLLAGDSLHITYTPTGMVMH